MSTTTQCPKCHDRGILHNETSIGWLVGQCDCQPPEHWKKESERKMKEWREHSRIRLGGEEGGEIQHAGR